MHCKADFYSQTNEGGDYSPENLVLDDVTDGGPGGERRRSERGRKREKPDYYDSLEFENKVKYIQKAISRFRIFYRLQYRLSKKYYSTSLVNIYF